MRPAARILLAAAGMVSATAGVGWLALAQAKEPHLPDWQLVGAHAACYQVGDPVALRLNTGVDFVLVGKLKVAHVDRTTNVVTFTERK